MDINNIKSPYTDKYMDLAYKKGITDVVNLLHSKLDEMTNKYINIRNNTYCKNTDTSECEECRADIKLEARLRTILEIIKMIEE